MQKKQNKHALWTNIVQFVKNTKISKTIIYYEEQSYQSLQACLRNVA